MNKKSKQHRLENDTVYHELIHDIEKIIYDCRVSVFTHDFTYKPCHSSIECHKTENASEIVFIPFTEEKSYRNILSIQISRDLSEFELKLIKELLKIYNVDIEKFPYYSHNDMWISLRNTRILRVISRISVFPSENFMEWADTMEKICRMSHEGESFSLNLFLLRNKNNIKIPKGGELIDLPTGIIRMDQLLSYKWIRAIANDRDISLVALNVSGVSSFVIIPTNNREKRFSNIHHSYDSLTSLVNNGVELISASNNNDLFIVLRGGNVFLNTRAGWRYYNIKPLESTIKRHTRSEKLSFLISKLIFEKSFERNGCIFCIIDKKDYYKLVNPEKESFFKKNIGNRNIGNEISYAMANKFSSIDGAVILSKEGDILGIACNLEVNSRINLEKKYAKKNKLIEGSRKNAAIESSRFGISICVSDDGPINVFENGYLLYTID